MGVLIGDSYAKRGCQLSEVALTFQVRANCIMRFIFLFLWWKMETEGVFDNIFKCNINLIVSLNIRYVLQKVMNVMEKSVKRFI